MLLEAAESEKLTIDELKDLWVASTSGSILLSRGTSISQKEFKKIATSVTDELSIVLDHVLRTLDPELNKQIPGLLKTLENLDSKELLNNINHLFNFLKL